MPATFRSFGCSVHQMETRPDHHPTFRQSPPGQRFQNRYWRHREARYRRSMVVRIASLTLGVVLAILGVLMLVLPGPGVLFLALAGALFASESWRIARVLDWIEIRGRNVWRRLRGKSSADKPHQY